nr:type I restriction-modification enzyme R subunit C-terminal domain-containing protein [Acidithiobacillus concretivorus]
MASRIILHLLRRAYQNGWFTPVNERDSQQGGGQGSRDCVLAGVIRIVTKPFISKSCAFPPCLQCLIFRSHTLPELFKDEGALRQIWSDPETPKGFLQGLAEKGYNRELLTEKYNNAIADAFAELGTLVQVREVFSGFQRYLYDERQRE